MGQCLGDASQAILTSPSMEKREESAQGGVFLLEIVAAIPGVQLQWLVSRWSQKLPVGFGSWDQSLFQSNTSQVLPLDFTLLRLIALVEGSSEISVEITWF